MTTVAAALAQAQAAGAGVLVAVGGGSAIDVAKAVSGLEHQTSELAFAVAEIRTLVEGASAVQ